MLTTHSSVSTRAFGRVAQCAMPRLAAGRQRSAGWRTQSNALPTQRTAQRAQGRSCPQQRHVTTRFRQEKQAEQSATAPPSPAQRVILLAMDGTPEGGATVAWAVDNLLRDGDQVHLIHVASEHYVTEHHTLPGGVMHGDAVRVHDHADDDADTRLHRDGAALARGMLDTHRDALSRRKVEVHAHVQPLHRPMSKMAVSQTLCDMAAAMDASVLVLTSRSHGGIMGLIKGSVADYVVQHCACPVAVLHPPPPHKHRPPPAIPLHARHLVMPVDGGRSLPAVRWLLGNMYHPGDKLHLLHVVPCLPLGIPVTGSDFLMHPGVEADPEMLAAQQRLADQEVAAWREEEEPAFRAVMEEAGATFDLDVRVQFTDNPANDISSVLCSKADAVHASAVVMAHRPRPALAAYLMGSVTSGVVHHCTAPVVVLHLADAGERGEHQDMQQLEEEQA